jgi:hypothetical protein
MWFTEESNGYGVWWLVGRHSPCIGSKAKGCAALLAPKEASSPANGGYGTAASLRMLNNVALHNKRLKLTRGQGGSRVALVAALAASSRAACSLSACWTD